MSLRLPLWFRGLTPDLRRRAEETLGESAEGRERGVAELRRLVEDRDDVYSRSDDLFLLRFLRTKKYDVEKSLRLLLNYYAFREKQGGTFVGATPSSCAHIIREMDAVLYAPRRMPSGSHVAVYRMGAFDVCRATARELVSTVLLIGEMILECEATQVCGGVFVLDMGGMSAHHYAQFCNAHFASFAISVVQDCLPERLKAVHFVNEPFLFHAIYKVVSLLLKKKLKERIRFHGRDLRSLHECVPAQFLPAELGGDLGPADYSAFESHFFAQEAYIESIGKYGLLGKKTAGEAE